MYWWDTVAFTGYGNQQFLGLFAAHAAGRAFERKRPDVIRSTRGAIGDDIYSKATETCSSLNTTKLVKPRSAAADPLGAGDDDGPGATGRRDHSRERRRRPSSHVHNNVRHGAGRFGLGDKIRADDYASKRAN
jgi:hypothetical protein